MKLWLERGVAKGMSRSTLMITGQGAWHASIRSVHSVEHVVVPFFFFGKYLYCSAFDYPSVSANEDFLSSPIDAEPDSFMHSGLALRLVHFSRFQK